MRTKPVILPGAAARFFAATGIAAAADYPFSGYFSMDAPSGEISDHRLLCATGFFRQDTDGSFVNYHIDMPAYEADGTIASLRYSGGTCELHADNIETCTVTFDTIPEEIGQETIDILGEITAEWVDLTLFESQSDARDWLEIGEPEPDDEIRLYRCPGYDAADLGPYLSDRESTLELDDRYDLVGASAEAASVATRLAIVERILGQQ
jgi:hypothetical protein